jgi:hypothetical protein
MKTNPRIHGLAKSAAFRFLAVTAMIATATAVALADTSPNPKPYTLFMGTDVGVGLKSEVYPVKDVSGNSWVVTMNGQQQVVSSRNGPVNLKLTPGLRLTEVSASIANLKSERSFTPANDPYAKFTRASSVAEADFAAQQTATNAANAQADSAMVAAGAASRGASAPIEFIPGSFSVVNGSVIVNAVTRAEGAAASAAVGVGAFPGMAVGAGSNPDLENFDAIDVAFEISSARPLEHPYIVAVSRYKERGLAEGPTRSLIYTQAITRIDSHARHVHFLAGGFKPGFKLVNLEVHVYNDGNEVATNLSPNRVELSRDEAFEYVKMDYLSAHPDATLPAAPAMGKLPADLPSRLAQGQFGDALYVKVSKDGVAADAYVDEACSKRVDDPYLETMLKDIRFEPALQNGKPVAGVAKLKLGQLIM